MNYDTYIGENSNKFTSTKELAKEVRMFVKKFKGYKFSITSDTSTINVYILESTRSVYKAKEDYTLQEKMKIETWGEEYAEHILTDEANKVKEEIYEYIESHNHKESDSYTDYSYSTFYSQIKVGKWDKEYKVTAK